MGVPLTKLLNKTHVYDPISVENNRYMSLDARNTLHDLRFYEAKYQTKSCKIPDNQIF